MEIKPITATELFTAPAFPAMVQAYAAESGTPELGQPRPVQQQYEALEFAGMWRCIGAFEGGCLVGFVSVLVTPHLHFGCNVASTECLWLDPSHRHGTAGLRLLREARRLAKDMGAKVLFVSAPHGSRLERLCQRLYRCDSSIFCVTLGD